MRGYRVWVYGFLGGLALLIGVNFWIWKNYTQSLLIPGPGMGDLSRVGYIDGSAYPGKEPSPVPLGRFESHNYDYRTPVDVVTIGDSFSNLRAKNDRLYQDWLVEDRGLKILNVQLLTGRTPLETAVILLNSGYLKLVGARVVLVQRIGRHVMIDFAREVDFDRTMPLDEIRKLYAELRYRNDPPKVGMLNIGNLKFVLYKLLYRLRDNAFFSKVYRHRLDRPLFSVRNDRELIFSYEDFDHARLATDEAALKLNDNFNRLAGKLKKIGVSLVFMPVPDKYDLYSESLVDNPYPPNPLFDKLRAQKMDYRWIDSKSILTEELRKGEKDLFYADDTHWSEKAARKIFEKVSLL